jgi:hypothetical protein
MSDDAVAAPKQGLLTIGHRDLAALLLQPGGD